MVVRSKASGLPVLDGLPSAFDLAVFKGDSAPVTIPAFGLSKTSLGVSEDGRHIYLARATSSESYTLSENALTSDAPLTGIIADRYLASGDTPFGDGIFFTPNGVIYDPLVGGFYGNIPVDFAPDSVAFNKTTGRFVWLLTGPGGSAQFRTYDSLTLNLLQVKVLPNVANGFSLLRPAGDRGWLALLTDPAVNPLTAGTPRFIPDTVPTPAARADLATPAQPSHIRKALASSALISKSPIPAPTPLIPHSGWFSAGCDPPSNESEPSCRVEFPLAWIATRLNRSERKSQSHHRHHRPNLAHNLARRSSRLQLGGSKSSQ